MKQVFSSGSPIKLSFTSINRHSGFPPKAVPLKPLPNICEYIIGEVVGLAIKIASVPGASNPVDKTP